MCRKRYIKVDNDFFETMLNLLDVASASINEAFVRLSEYEKNRTKIHDLVLEDLEENQKTLALGEDDETGISD